VDDNSKIEEAEMSIDIKEVVTKKDIKEFIKVPFSIYKDDENYVPPLIMDEMDTFNKKKNPAFETAEARMFIAYKDGKPAGRIAGILSHIANEKYNTKNIRWGWFDSIEDFDVAHTLFKLVEDWGKELGMETLTGPHGFSDLDPEGMLIEGFDQLPTIAVYYNYPYYVDFAEKYGFQKDIDYVEFRSLAPKKGEIPPKLLRLGERIKERSKIRVIKFKSKRDAMKYGKAVFDVLDDAFEEIYGSVPLTQKQVQYYIKKYISLVDKDMLTLAVDENNHAVGFMIAMPSFSEAFQKAKGKLFPFGFIYVLKALRNYEVLDFYLAGVRKKYRGHGIDLLMVLEAAKAAGEKGVVYVESNPELESNKKIQAQWKYFNPTQHKRRRIFKKAIT
jgi:hypothetical protein